MGVTIGMFILRKINDHKVNDLCIRSLFLHIHICAINIGYITVATFAQKQSIFSALVLSAVLLSQL